MPTIKENEVVIHALGYLHQYFSPDRDGGYDGPNLRWLIDLCARNPNICWSVETIGRVFTDAAHMAEAKREEPELPALPYAASVKEDGP